MKDILSDENLMAYIDNELDKEQSAQIQQALQQSPEAQEKVRIFQESAEALRVYDDTLQSPLPQELIDTIENVDTTNVNIKPAQKERKLLPGNKFIMSIAASVIFTMGILLGNALVPPNTSVNNSQLSLVQQALETRESGEPLARKVRANSGSAVATQYEIVPLDTFVNSHQDFCRSFEYIKIPGDTLLGLACRTEKSTWEIQLMVPSNLSFEEPQTSSDTYQTASGGRTLINMTKSNMGSLRQVHQEEEALLIDRNWTP